MAPRHGSKRHAPARLLGDPTMMILIPAAAILSSLVAIAEARHGPFSWGLAAFRPNQSNTPTAFGRFVKLIG